MPRDSAAADRPASYLVGTAAAFPLFFRDRTKPINQLPFSPSAKFPKSGSSCESRVNPVEKFFEIKVNYDAVARGNVLLRLGYSLMSGASRSEAVTVPGKPRVPAFLQNLQQGLLDQSVDDARHAELSDPALRLGDFNPLDRPRLVGSFEQLRPNAWPVLTQVVLRVVNGHPIDARTALVLANAFPRSYEIPSVTYLLH